MTRTPLRSAAASMSLAALLVLGLAPQAHAADASTWEQVSQGLGAGDDVVLAANVEGGAVIVSTAEHTTLDLAGNDLTLRGAPALEIAQGAHLTITDSVGGGTLTAIGTGLNDAAIGTPADFRSEATGTGTLIVDGADVVADFDLELGRPSGAAVGGGFQAAGMDVTVTSGSLTVDSDGGNGAGIGGGEMADGGSLTVTGGLVSVENASQARGAAIGGGAYGGNGGDVDVLGGTVIATVAANSSGAAIGGGSEGDGGELSISGGTVTATNTGTALASAVGGGYSADGGTVRVEGGLLDVTVGGDGAGIGGGGNGGSGGTVYLYDGAITVDRVSGRWAAGIGGGSAGSSGTNDGGQIWVAAGSLDVEGGYSASTLGAGGPSTVDGSEPPYRGIVVVEADASPELPVAAAGPQGSSITYVGATNEDPLHVENTVSESINDPHRTVIDFGYAVHFDAAGGSPEPPSQLLDYGNAVTAPADPVRAGHEFSGWFDGSNLWSFDTPVTRTVTLTAGWDINVYDVTFDAAGGGSVPAAQVEHGGTVAEPSAPTRTGHDFTGWMLDGEPYDFDTAVTGDLTLTAGWDIRTYDVTFDSAGGTPVTTRTVEHGASVTEPPAPSRDGHEFTGWVAGGDPYDFDMPVTGPVDLTATWDIHTFTIRVFPIPGEEVTDTFELAYRDQIRSPATPSRTGHDFTGWFVDGEPYAFSTPVTEDVDLVGGWEIQSYEVTFDSDGAGAVESQTIEYGATLTEPTEPERAGHEFSGWFDGDQRWDFAAPVTSAMDLTARWDLEPYDIVFDSTGGSDVATVEVAFGGQVNEPDPPTRVGHDFAGWRLDGGAYDFEAPVTGDMTLTAAWDVQEYEVTFDSNGGSAVDAQSVAYGSPATAPTPPIREGFTFGGWFEGDTEWDFDTAVDGPRTLVATWHAPALIVDETVNAGEELSIRGTYLPAGETVTITLATASGGGLGGGTAASAPNVLAEVEVQADANGTINAAIAVPSSAAGPAVVTASGPDGELASASLVILSAPAETGADDGLDQVATDGSDAESLSATGMSSWWAALTALALTLVGAGLLVRRFA